MTLEQMIVIMNEDLKNEYKHHRFYLHCSFILGGLERLYLGPWLKQQASEELDHVQQFADKIVALGGMPTTEANLYPVNLTKAEDILACAIAMEKEVVVNYHERIKQVEDFYQTTNQYYDLILHYEEQIEDSQRDIDEMIKML